MSYKGGNNRISEETLDKGVDGISAISDIPAGYSLEAENVDLGQPGVLRKRSGYNIWGCKLPIRTKSIWDLYGNLAITFANVSVESCTLDLYDNTAANATATQDSSFIRVNDSGNTLYVEINSALQSPVTLDTIFEFGNPDVDVSDVFSYAQPVEVFDSGEVSGVAKFLIPISFLKTINRSFVALDDVTPIQLVVKVCEGYVHPRILSTDITAMENISTATVRQVKVSFLAGAKAGDLPVGTLIYFESGLGNAGVITQVSDEYFIAQVDNAIATIGIQSTNYFSMRYFTGRSLWYKSNLYDFTLTKSGVNPYDVSIYGPSTVVYYPGTEYGFGPIFSAVSGNPTAETGFIYGLDADAGYVNLLHKFFDAEANEERLICGYQGAVFVEKPHPAATIRTLISGIYTGPSGGISANTVTDTFTIPITGAENIYLAGDEITIMYALDTKGTFASNTYDIKSVSIGAIEISAGGEQYLQLPQYTRIKFKRTSAEVYVAWDSSFPTTITPITSGMTLQYGEKNTQKPWYAISQVDFSAETATGCKLIFNSAIEWESDSYLTMLSYFFPIITSQNQIPINYSATPDTLQDLPAVTIDRSVVIAAGKSGLWRYNGSQLINMHIPTPPSGFIRNVTGSGGTLRVDEADDGTKIGRYYRFYVSYSYVELVNGKLIRYESGLNPIGSYRITSKPAIDGSLTSQIVELQVSTLPKNIGLPVENMTINVYRSPSGTANDVEGDTEVLLKEVEVANDPLRPFITILAGVAPKLQFNEDNYDFLYISQGGDKTKDEASRQIVDVPLASTISVLENRVIAANGLDHPYVNFICNDVFSASDGSFAAHARFTLVPPATYTPAVEKSVENGYTFFTCPLDLTTTSGFGGGPGSPFIPFQVFQVPTFSIKAIVYSDSSHLFKVTGSALVAGKKYLLRIANGKTEGKVPGGKDSYYDGFGFETQMFEATATATQLSAQSKWVSKDSSGTVITPTESVLIFEESTTISLIASNSGVFIAGNSGIGENPKGAISFTLKLPLGSTTYSVGDKLIFKGLGTCGQVKDSKGNTLNWDTQIIAEVATADVVSNPNSYSLTLYIMGGVTHFAVAPLLSAIAVSNLVSGVSNPPFTIFKLQTPVTPRAMTDFSLSPATASIQLTTTQAISVTAGMRIAVDGLPESVPLQSGMNYNTSFEVISYAVDTFVVKVSPPPTMRGTGGQDFTADADKGKVFVIKDNIYQPASPPNLLHIELTPQNASLVIGAGDWVYIIARGRDYDSYSLQLSGWFKLAYVAISGGPLVPSVQPGTAISGIRVEYDQTITPGIDFSAVSGLSATRVVFAGRSIALRLNTIYVPIPVPTKRLPNSDVTGTLYGPYDGYTPLEKVCRRLAHGISTVLHESHFAYWGKFRPDLEVDQDIPTNGVRVQPHLWPDDKYRHLNGQTTNSSATNESLWNCFGATGYWKVEGSSRFDLVPTYPGPVPALYTAKKYRPSRVWWTNPSGSSEGIAFRELSKDEIESQDGEEIVGAVPFQTYNILGKRSSVWRLSFAGGVTLSVDRVPSSIGVASAKNMVPTERGVFFLHDSGAYITDGSLVEPILQTSRYFNDKVVQNSSVFPLTAGHHNPLTKTVVLGVPLSAAKGELATDISGQFSFNYSLRNVTLNTIDYGWSVNTQFPATKWTRIRSDDYFATYSGTVQRMRTEITDSRFSDGNLGIPFKVKTRFIDSQDPVNFKFFRSIFFQFGKETSANIKVSLAWDFAQSYTQVSLFAIDKEGFGTAPFGTSYWGCDKFIETVRRTPTQNRAAQMSILIENDEVNSATEVFGVFLESSQSDSKLNKQPGT